MEDSERLMALLQNIRIRRSMFSVVTYDMYLTDKRMVFIHSKYRDWGLVGAAVGGVAGAIVGSVLQASSESSKRNEKENNVLDELLAKDKENFEVQHEDVDKVKLYRFRVGVNLKHMLAVYSEKSSARVAKPFGLTPQQSDELSSVLPNISALKGKIEL